MKLLVLGGTQFVGHAVVGDALARGWEVSVANRGSSGPARAGVRAVTLDRTVPGAYDALRDERFDIVVDTWSGRPDVVIAVLDSAHPKPINEVQAALDKTDLSGKNLLVVRNGEQDTRYTVNTSEQAVDKVKQTIVDTFGSERSAAMPSGHSRQHATPPPPRRRDQNTRESRPTGSTPCA